MGGLGSWRLGFLGGLGCEGVREGELRDDGECKFFMPFFRRGHGRREVRK